MRDFLGSGTFSAKIWTVSGRCEQLVTLMEKEVGVGFGISSRVSILRSMATLELKDCKKKKKTQHFRGTGQKYQEEYVELANMISRREGSDVLH